jgi:S-adenosylmethionine synthetase
MRSSKILSPSHLNKICDIVVESIIQLYNNSKEPYKSNLFSYIIDDKLTVVGEIYSKNHFTNIEILNYIVRNIDIHIDIDLMFKKSSLTDLVLNINTDTFLGYYCDENENGIPFEQMEALNVSKYLYEILKLPFVLEVTINGKFIDVLIEINFENTEYISNLLNAYFSNSENYDTHRVTVVELDKKILYRSGYSFISNSYGPRVPYGNTNFIGLDINNNYRYSHLVSREIAKKFLKQNNLRYCLVELTYHSNNELPIQIGVKGNAEGIYIEHGTFFQYLSDYNMYMDIKNKVIKNITDNSTLLVDMAKWGLYEKI